MPASVAAEYYQAITVIDAEKRLVDMNITDYPKMKNEGRKKFHRDMRKLAQPEHLRQTMDFDDFIKRMTND